MPLSPTSLLSLAFSLPAAASAAAAALLCAQAGWRPWLLPVWLASRPAWRSCGVERVPRRVLAAAEAAAVAALYAAVLTPVALIVTWAALLFARVEVPQYGALVLLVGLGSLLAAWALALWRADGWAPDCRAALRLAASAAALFAAFEACAAFSSGNGVRLYTSSELFFAIMSLAFALSLLSLVPLALAASAPRAPLRGYACAAYFAISRGEAPPGPPAAAAAASPRAPLSARRAAALYAASVTLTLAGAAVYAGLSADHRGAGFVAAGAALATDAAAALAWRGALLLHRAPGPYLAAAGLARGALLLFSPRNWFLGHALLYALVASAFAAAAAARRWPLLDAEARRAEAMQAVLDAVIASHVNAKPTAQSEPAAAPAQAPAEGEAAEGGPAAQLPKWLVSCIAAVIPRGIGAAACPGALAAVLGSRTALWAALTAAFAAELGVVAARHPPPVPAVNSAQQQWRFGVAALLLPPAACAALAFARAVAAMPPPAAEAAAAKAVPPPEAAASADVDVEAPAGTPAAAAQAAAAATAARAADAARRAVAFFWVGTLDADSGAALRHGAAASACWSAVGIALGFATASSIVLAFGVFAPLLAATAALLTRDSFELADAVRSWRPACWTRRQRRAALWVMCNVAALGGIAGIVAGDVFAAHQRASGHSLAPRVRYSLPGFQALAITLGLAFAQLAASASVQLYRQLELRALASPLGAALLLVPCAYAGGALAISRAPHLAHSVAVRRSPRVGLDVVVALVPALAAPGVLAYALGMLLWRDAANWAPRPPAGAAALLAGGLAACSAAGALVTALAAPVLGGGFLFAVVAAAVACPVRSAWAANGRSLPHWLAPAAAVALVCAAALGLAAGFVSDQPFRGFSVAYLIVLFLGAARAARRLHGALLSAGSSTVAVPGVVFAPRLLPAYEWNATAARAAPLSGHVMQLLMVALGVFAWGALCAVCVSPASGGAAAAAGAACVAAVAAACAAHASTSRAAAALAVLSAEALACAVTAAAAAVGIVQVPDDVARQSAVVALGDAWKPHDDNDVAAIAASRADVAAAAAALGRSRWLYIGAPPPVPGPEDALGQSRAAAAAALLAAHEACGVASLRFEAFAAALAHMAGAAAAAERGAADARLRAFLLDVAGVAASPADVARWSEARRAALAAARDSWLAKRAAEEAQQRRRIEEEEEGRRRRAAAAAAEEQRLRLLRQAAEEERRRKEAEAAAEAARLAALAEQERLRRAAEEEAQRRRKEAEEEAAAVAAEAARLAELARQERLRLARLAEEERRRKEEEDAALAAAAAAEAEARRKAIEEARRKRAKEQAEEERRRQAEREAAEAEAAKEAARREAARLAAEAARRKAAEEAAAKAAAEEKRRKEEQARKAAEEAEAARSDGLSECKAAAAALVAQTKGRGLFCDPDFPASDGALFVGAKLPAGEKPFFDPLKCTSWTRACAGGRSLFGGSPDAAATRVKQGALGDCWFISALAVFAAPGAVPALFELPPTAEGAACVRFFRGGRWVPVVIDDRLPYDDSRRTLLFAQSSDSKELWVSLLEKAYAKFYGSYQALEGGWVSDALVDLTGGAGEVIVLNDDDAALAKVSGALWARVRAAAAASSVSGASATRAKAQDARLLLACGSPKGSDKTFSDAGIVQGHAYSILAAHDVDGVRLLQLRNPWGSDREWNGAWSDQSPEWTPRMRKLLNYTPQSEDGVFWMQWEDWLANYAKLYACRVFPRDIAHRVTGAWTAQTGGGRYSGNAWHLNPRLLLRRTDGATRATPVYATLTQLSDEPSSPDAAVMPRNRMADQGRSIRLDILRENPGERYASWSGLDWARAEKLRVSPSVSYRGMRQVAHDLELPPSASGWLLVPSTFDVGETGSWVIEVYTKARTPPLAALLRRIITPRSHTRRSRWS